MWKIPVKIQPQLKCRYCDSYLSTTPIYSTQDKLVCSRCYTNLPDSIKSTCHPQIGLEIILPYIKFPCKHNHFDCAMDKLCEDCTNEGNENRKKVLSFSSTYSMTSELSDSALIENISPVSEACLSPDFLQGACPKFTFDQKLPDIYIFGQKNQLINQKDDQSNGNGYFLEKNSNEANLSQINNEIKQLQLSKDNVFQHTILEKSMLGKEKKINHDKLMEFLYANAQIEEICPAAKANQEDEAKLGRSKNRPNLLNLEEPTLKMRKFSTNRTDSENYITSPTKHTLPLWLGRDKTPTSPTFSTKSKPSCYDSFPVKSITNDLKIEMNCTAKGNKTTKNLTVLKYNFSISADDNTQLCVIKNLHKTRFIHINYIKPIELFINGAISLKKSPENVFCDLKIITKQEPIYDSIDHLNCISCKTNKLTDDTQCVYGKHQVCGQCKNACLECKTQAKLTNIINCKNPGCVWNGSYLDSKTHQYECENISLACMFHDCSYASPALLMKGHLQQKHANFTKRAPFFESTFSKIDTQYAMIAYHKIFVCKMFVYDEYFECLVELFENIKRNSEFSFEIEVYLDKKIVRFNKDCVVYNKSVLDEGIILPRDAQIKPGVAFKINISHLYDNLKL